jgi:hypothetical protein
MTPDAPFPQPPPDDRLLDRLVDGELCADERAALLAALDARPDGWRLCATAFLEAQAWAISLRTLDTESRVTVPRPPGLRPFARYGTIAAAFVVAFVAGFLTRDGTASRSTSQGPRETPYATRDANGDVPTPPTPRPAPAQRSGSLAAAVRADSRVRLPVFEADGADGAEISRQISALPEYVRKQLERQGYEVEGDRQLLSAALGDGRSVTVPVERLKYRYVGYRVH